MSAALPRGRVYLIAGALCALGAFPALAKDTLQPYVEVRRMWDDNLFRTETDARSATVDILSAGAALDWRYGRQQVTGRASANQVRYPEFKQLDYDGYNLDLQWNWQTANGLSGLLGCSESQTQSSLADIQAALSNLRTQQQCKAGFFVNPSDQWQARLLVFDSQSSNSVASQQVYDWKENGIEVKLNRASNPGNYADGFLRVADGNYLNTQAAGASQADNNYQQREAGVEAGYRASGALHLDARISYVQRKLDQSPERDFAGPAGRFSLDWRPSGKLLVSGALYRNVGAVEDLSASYIVTDGAYLSGAWTPTAKTRVSLDGRLEQRDYAGDPGPSNGLQRRKDEVRSLGAGFDYQPYPLLGLGLLARQERRDSNEARRPYRANTVQASLRLSF